MIYNQDHVAWHLMFNDFLDKRDVDTYHRTPFFWWLFDHGYRDKPIDTTILTQEFDAFLDTQTDIVYAGNTAIIESC